MNKTLKQSEIIINRHSCRNFSGKPLTGKDLSSIEQIILKNIETPFGNKPRFSIVGTSDDGLLTASTYKTYGFIKGTKSFIAGAIKDNPFALEDFGFAFEKIILKLTVLEIGTCWLGGTFSRGFFAKAINLLDDESIPAITPIGYPAKNKSIAEKIVRFAAGSDNRKPFETLFFENNFDTPLTEAEATTIEALNMVRLAPSASNKQPWRIIKQKKLFHFYMARSKNYKKQSDFIGAADLQRVDMGIAMAHLDVILSEKKVNYKWLNSDPFISAPEETIYTASCEILS